MRRALVRLAWVTAAVVASLVLLSQALLPAAGRFLLERRLAPALGMRLDLEHVEIALLPPALILEGIAASADGEGRVRAFRCERLAARLRARELVRRRLAFAAVEVTAPQLEVDPQADAVPVGGDGGVGWPVRIDALSIAGAEVRVARGSSPEIQVSVSELRLAGLSLAGPGAQPAWRFDELVVGLSRALVPWEAEATRGFTFGGTTSGAAAGGAFPVQLGLSSEAGGSLALSGRFDLAEARLDGEIAGQEIELAPLLSALAPELGVREGRVRGRLAVAAARTPEGRYALAFRRPPGGRGPDLEIADLVFRAGDGNGLSGGTRRWAAVVEEIGLSGLPTDPRIDARLARLDLMRPELAYVRSAATPNGDAEPGPSATSVRVETAELRIEDGLLTLRDATTDPPLEGRWAHINGDASGVRVPSFTLERFVLAGSGAGGDPLRVSGRVEPGGSLLQLEGRGDALVRYSPYLEARTGIQVVGGTSALRSDVRLGPEGVQASGRVVLSQVELKGSEPLLSFGRLGDLPLPVLLALLSDARGDVALDVDLDTGGELRGLDWPSLVGAALRRSLVRAASSPLRVVARGGDEEQKPPAAGGLVGFVPGTARLTDEGRARVATTAQLLAESPQLAVVVHGAVTAADRATSRFAEADPESDPAGELAASRARAVASLLTVAHGVAADRIRIGAPPGADWPGAPAAVIALGVATEGAPTGSLAAPQQDSSPPPVGTRPE